jgi:hypothetical protein
MICGQKKCNRKLMKIKRLFRFEFWPFWLFYIPTYFNWAVLAIKARYTTYFTATNPLMNNSGAVNVSKLEYLSKLPAKWVPKTKLINSSIPVNDLKNAFDALATDFPVILKPDKGERGKEVFLIQDFDQLVEKVKNSHYSTLLLQIYCSYPNEAGILFYRYPNQKQGAISSVTTKEFFVLKGDGQSSWEELLRKNMRVKHRLEDLLKRATINWQDIPSKGTHQLIEPIGSHNLGTKFTNGIKLNSTILERRINQWADQLPGFYYGRFDVKYKDWNSLLKGEDFSLMEINGVNAEPTHIYHSGYGILKAYRDIFSHMKIIYEISEQNHSLGIKRKRLLPFLTELFKTATR